MLKRLIRNEVTLAQDPAKISVSAPEPVRHHSSTVENASSEGAGIGTICPQKLAIQQKFNKVRSNLTALPEIYGSL